MYEVYRHTWFTHTSSYWYIHARAQTHARIVILTHNCTCTNIHASSYWHTHARAQTHTHRHTYTHMHVHKHTRIVILTHTCTCTHTHSYTHSRLIRDQGMRDNTSFFPLWANPQFSYFRVTTGFQVSTQQQEAHTSTSTVNPFLIHAVSVYTICVLSLLLFLSILYDQFRNPARSTW